jgi:hypothetical protein
MAGKIYKLDHTGHGVLTEWKDKPKEIAAAAQIFGELQKAGNLLVTIPDDGSDGEVVETFRPDAEMLMVPALQGG